VAVQQSISVDLELIDHYNRIITNLERYINRTATNHAPQALHLLKTVYGIGKTLSLVILYEIHDINRFPRVQDFASYSRDLLTRGGLIGVGQVLPPRNRRIRERCLEVRKQLPTEVWQDLRYGEDCPERLGGSFSRHYATRMVATQASQLTTMGRAWLAIVPPSSSVYDQY